MPGAVGRGRLRPGEAPIRPCGGVGMGTSDACVGSGAGTRRVQGHEAKG